jgi:hypothetical protein
MLGTRATRSAPAPAPGDDERGTHAHSGAQTHTEGSAPPQNLGVRVPERIGIDCELECRVVRAATRPPAGAAFRWSRRRSFFPARRLGAGRPRPLPRVAHHRLGGVARRRLARERRRAGSRAELLRGGRRRVPLANYGESPALRPTAAPRRSRPSPERAYTRNEGHGHRRASRTYTVEPLEDPVPRELPDESPEREEPAEPPREPGEGTGVRRRPHGSAALRRADRRLARLVRRRSRGRCSIVYHTLWPPRHELVASCRSSE